MENLSLILILLGIATVLAVAANRISLPFPILLVLVGVGIGFIPNLPHIELNPDIVFLIFLPPILYSAAWYTSWRDFKQNLRPISLLAVGLVLTTTTAVATALHFVSGIEWSIGFVLGAIVSPPDAVAATAITQRLNVPKRIITILEGESLVNDSTGLIAYRFAVTAVVTGFFSFWKATAQFFLVAIGGIAIGLAVAYAVAYLHKVLRNNPTIETSLTLLTPFSLYLLAESLHVSGVLAVVAAGLHLTWKAPLLFSSRTRLQAVAAWDTLIFLLNGFIFILIGLQLPDIMKTISGQYALPELFLYAFAVCFTVIIIRIAWVFPGAYLPRYFSKRIRERETTFNWKFVTVVAWTGMRGIVTLAAALALPLKTASGSIFPHRDLIIFLAFSVILATLVIQGFSLPYLIKSLKIDAVDESELEEMHARSSAATEALIRIEEMYDSGLITLDMKQRLRIRYDLALARLTSSPVIIDGAAHESYAETEERLIEEERNLIIHLRNQGIIGDEAMRRIEYELDLESSRLERSRQLWDSKSY